MNADVIPLHRKRVIRPVPMKQRAEWVKLYEAGWPMTRIAEFYGRHKSTVRYVLKQEGVEFRPRGANARGRIPHSEIVKTAFLYERCLMSYKEIGEELGIHPTSVQWRLNKAGVPKRSRSEANRLAYRKQKMSRTGRYASANGRAA